MLPSPILPLPVNRKQTSSIPSATEKPSCSSFTGNTFTISAIVSSALPVGSGSKKRSRTSLSSSSLDSQNDDTINLLSSIKPSDYARAGFKANGFNDIEAILKDVESRFLPPSASMLEAYNTEILDAVRSNNLDKAKALYHEGQFSHGCNACNRFGESILHIACRRGHLKMVQFLVDEVGLSCITIRDDYHRTPLHDAFWTSTASPDVVAFLLRQPHVTELLLCKDKRGFTPLDYSRGEDRGRWLRFLWERKSELRPTLLSPEIYDDEDECRQGIRRSDFAPKTTAELMKNESNKRIKIIG